MRFNKHWEVEGKHAFLGASKHHWINYDLDKMKRIWENKFASEKGTRLHALAAFCIRERIKLERNGTTLSLYVNDAIGFRMTPEVVLVFSENCFGTADAISFDPDTLELRIHDLKTGVHPGSFEQLRIYAALFCHEYKKNPYDLTIILRIYQSDQFFELSCDGSEVEAILKKMHEFEPEIEKMKEVML